MTRPGGPAARLRIGLTYDLAKEQELTGAMPEDFWAELDDESTVRGLAHALGSLGHQVVHIGGLPGLVATLQRGRLDVDLVFNVAEGTRGRAREAQVPALLEAYGVAYTGADPVTMALTLDKALTKLVWRGAGLPTAAFSVMASPSDLQRLPAPFPLFVKPVREGSSMGVDGGSVVNDAAALEARVERVWAGYRQPALVEAYLPGREFTVGIVGAGESAWVLGVVETFARGHVSGYAEKRGTGIASEVREFRPLDAAQDGLDDGLEEELGDLALRAYHAVGCRDVGRVDLRCDPEGRPNLVEINALPGLVEGRSALPILAYHAGHSYQELVALILERAVERLGNERAPGEAGRPDDRPTRRSTP